MAEAPYLVALNLTRRCNLNCAHCYLDAGARNEADAAELTTAEIRALIDDVATLSNETMLVLTGGEPLLRPDLELIAGHAAGLGLMVVVGTNGLALNDRRVAGLQAAGVAGVGISVDSLDPERHDAFRGLPGSFVRTMHGIDACRRAGMGLQIHFTVTDDTADELEPMIAFARSCGAIALNVFFLVCTGRGRHVSDISRDGYDRTLRRLTRAAHASEGMMIRAKCAPHFKRMALELDPDWPITMAHGYEAGGCLAGTRYARVTPGGEVTPCPYMDLSAGSLRDLRFADIWHNAPVFQQLRAPRLTGRCGICEYAGVCGGCRARPYAASGDLMGEDRLCAYQPDGSGVIPEIAPPQAIAWTSTAEARLDRVPPFVRRFVRQRAEAFARENGCVAVTAEHLEMLVQRRFGGTGPSRPDIAGVRARSGDRP
ncbi:MAG: radical SAM protein [Rhodobacteraceae bacterium]|nr:radical SAM protein [Paracoccaceae bacterium]